MPPAYQNLIPNFCPHKHSWAKMLHMLWVPRILVDFLWPLTWAEGEEAHFRVKSVGLLIIITTNWLHMHMVTSLPPSLPSMPQNLHMMDNVRSRRSLLWWDHLGYTIHKCHRPSLWKMTEALCAINTVSISIANKLNYHTLNFTRLNGFPVKLSICIHLCLAHLHEINHNSMWHGSTVIAEDLLMLLNLWIHQLQQQDL